MIEKAILKINPNAEFTIDDNDINQITWLNETTPISNADIQAQFLNVKIDYLRRERDKKLKETDFYALSDVTMSAEMTTYRQALRDLPSNYTTSDSSELAEDLSNLVWPTKP
jgi:hypothetical protein